ncbi:MAG: hypothetical protein B6D56_08390 [Candidatus Omnitrophica bacterium 4484_70.1]|nr:MAG: hypothetical protein B6D56_08390 [Candidatus Omnitrophica bacterium 4484_70.1]
MNSCRIPTCGSCYATQEYGQVLTCYSVEEEIKVETNKDTIDGQVQNFFVEAELTLNPSTGTYTRKDFFPLNNTTYFKEEILCEPEEYKRYFSISSQTENEFYQVYSSLYNLTGDERAVAYTAFALKKLGCKFIIIISGEERNLLNFCIQGEYSYQISE